jgi:hypothetical protein
MEKQEKDLKFYTTLPSVESAERAKVQQYHSTLVLGKQSISWNEIPGPQDRARHSNGADLISADAHEVDWDDHHLEDNQLNDGSGSDSSGPPREQIEFLAFVWA